LHINNNPLKVTGAKGDVVSSTGSSEQMCEYRPLGMINDRKEFQ